MKTLEKILQSQGFGSRRACRGLIEEGAVKVHDQVVTDPQAKFATAGLQFAIDDEPFDYHEKVYAALHKPAGYECSRKPSHHPGVLSLLPDMFSERNVQSVGRLDHDTTGLLLLSDDGDFIHQTSSPKHHVPKVYVATTDAAVDEALVTRLLTGVQLLDEPAPLAALQCRKLGEHQIEITLDQGKYHQVKRMLAAAGNHCVALQRTAIGALSLPMLDLEPGEWRYLTLEHREAMLRPPAEPDPKQD